MTRTRRPSTPALPLPADTACHDHPVLPPETWTDEQDNPAAVAVCMYVCPGRAQCLARVMQFSPQPAGTWAGLGQAQRERLQKRYLSRRPAQQRARA